MVSFRPLNGVIPLINGQTPWLVNRGFQLNMKVKVGIRRPYYECFSRHPTGDERASWHPAGVDAFARRRPCHGGWSVSRMRMTLRP